MLGIWNFPFLVLVSWFRNAVDDKNVTSGTN
jgi:hypothetical protein